MTQPSQTQIHKPISSFLTLRGSRLPPPRLVTHPTGGRGNVLSVHFRVHSMHRSHECCILCGHTFRLETNCDASRSSTRVGSNESFVLWKQLSDVTTCSDVSSVIEHHKTPLHRRAQAPVFWKVVFMLLHIHSSNTKCCYSARFFIRRSINLAIVLPPSRTSSWWSCPLKCSHRRSVVQTR